MFSVDSLRKAFTSLFRKLGEKNGYDADEVEKLLAAIDFFSLAQAVKDDMAPVHSFVTRGKLPTSFNYFGPELFDQPAALISEKVDLFGAEDAASTCRFYELWLRDDMTFVPVSCIFVSYDDGEYVCAYRTVKDCDPLDAEVALNLEGITASLIAMYERYQNSDAPIYEL